MTHDHKDGCCGTGKDMGKCASGPRGWITGIAVVVAIGSLAYAVTQKNGGNMNVGAKPKVDTATLITGQDVTVAKLNGETIKKSDIALAVKDMGANVPPEAVDKIVPAFLDQYINLRLINKEAEKAGVAKQDDVQMQLAGARDQIVRAAYLKTLFDGKITDDALKAAYKAKYEDQPMPEEMRARHILVDDEQKARDLIAQLSRGASFEKLAQENSKDPSGQRGGDLGYFTQGEMVPEFGKAAFALRPGQMTMEPVKTQFGWHIIRIEDRRQRVKPSFEEAKPLMEQEARQAILDAKIAELRKDAKIEVEEAGKAPADGSAAPAAGAAPAADGAAAPAATPAPGAAPAPAATPAP